MKNPHDDRRPVEPTEAEKLARRIANGDENAVLEMKAFLNTGDRMKSLPVLLAMKFFRKFDGELPMIGEFALGVLKDPALVGRIDPGIVGGLIGIVAMHLPSRLPQAIKWAIPDERFGTMVFEALLSVRMMLAI